MGLWRRRVFEAAPGRSGSHDRWGVTHGACHRPMPRQAAWHRFAGRTAGFEIRTAFEDGGRFSYWFPYCEKDRTRRLARLPAFSRKRRFRQGDSGWRAANAAGSTAYLQPALVATAGARLTVSWPSGCRAHGVECCRHVALRGARDGPVRHAMPGSQLPCGLRAGALQGDQSLPLTTAKVDSACATASRSRASTSATRVSAKARSLMAGTLI